MRGIIIGLLMLSQYIPSGSRAPTGSSGPITVSAWPMNEGTGLTFADVSGNSNTATVNTGGALTWTPNIIKSGVTSPSWTGGSGYGLAANASLTNFDGTAPFSVGVWIKNSTGSVEQAIFGNLDAPSGYQGWELNLQNNAGNAVPQFLLINTYPGNALETVATSAVVSDGALHYIVATYDGSRSPTGVKIYVDGVSETLTPTPGVGPLTSSSASGLAVRMAERLDATDGYFGGMGYAQIVTGVWSAGQVATNFAAGPGIY